MDAVLLIKERYETIEAFLDERQKRLLLATEAKLLGYGGISTVSRETGVSRPVIHDGLKEIEAHKQGQLKAPKNIRQPGGGRKKAEEKDQSLRADLEQLVEPVTRGDPESPLRWTCKSTRTLADALNQETHRTSHRMVADMLRDMKYSLQGNRKTLEGGDRPDRDEQFQHINNRAKAHLAQNLPVISVDTKKKELVGQYRNAGKTWRPEGQPEEVKVHDFIDKELGRANPYGVYDLNRNEGWVSVGTDHDTASFAVATIRHWWKAVGKQAYPDAKELMITADGGGSNGSRVKLWKLELQKLADDEGLTIEVCHFPPGTSKWNKIEHRLFSFISMNWKGQPLVSHEVIIQLIAGTTTKSGLKVRAVLDRTEYPLGVKVSKKEMDSLNITRNTFHGEWNYQIKPRMPEAIL